MMLAIVFLGSEGFYFLVARILASLQTLSTMLPSTSMSLMTRSQTLSMWFNAVELTMIRKMVKNVDFVRASVTKKSSPRPRSKV